MNKQKSEAQEEISRNLNDMIFKNVFVYLELSFQTLDSQSTDFKVITRQA